jgi:outer membrane protein assembly factor BamB
MDSDTDKTSENNEIKSPWYRSAVTTAIVCAVFSFIVLTFFVINYIQWRKIDTNWEIQSLNLKKEFGQNQDNEKLLAKIRELDLEFRQRRIRRLDFSRKGGYLLLGSIVIMLIAIKSADTFKKKLPAPAASGNRDNEQLIQAKFARWAVTVGLGVFGLGALVLAISNDIDFGRTKGAGTSYPSFEEFSQNWPAFRGPEGLGIVDFNDIPDRWNGKNGEGILWKTEIPLEGNNSPVVWGDRVFLSGGDPNELKVFCFDAVSGKLLWTGEVESPHLKNEEEPFEVYEGTGFATPTVVTDGRRVYAIFATGDIGAFDFNGKNIWTKSLGIPDSSYSYASSLAMYRNLVLIQFDQGGPEDGISKMIALDGITGQTVWETKRPVPNSWSSPIVTKIDEQFQLITCGDPWVIAYDPADGTELWRANCLYGDIAPSPIYSNGLIFAVEPDACLFAIRTGGKGDVTETHVAWKNDEWGPSICSPVSNGELTFMLASEGLLACYKNSDGTKLYEQDLRENFMASPTLVGDKLYILTEDGVMFIIQAGAEYKELSKCELGDKCSASPAFADGRIYIRGLDNLYCIENMGTSASYPSFELVSRNWPSFRGPEGLGIVDFNDIPESWDGKSGEGIIWKTEIPLHGNNSPVVWEDRVFLSGGDPNQLNVFCYDAVSGELLWTGEIESPHLKNKEEPFEVMEDTGFASPTLVTDGRRVYTIFVTGDIGAFDFYGKNIWTKSLGIPDSSYGYASSLAMYRNLVLIQYDQGGPEDGISKMIALDGATGQTVWETKRPVPNSWASPIVAKIGEQLQLITCADPWVIAYDPLDGSELWRVNCLYGDVASSPIYSNGLIFAIEPDARLIAIRADGQGDVTKTHIAWDNDEWGPNICSPVSNGELVFMLASEGLIACYKNSDGTKLYEQDLRDNFMASPTLVGDKLYLLNEEGVMLIIQAGPEYKEMTKSELDEKCYASPAFMDGRIYIRGLENLYCIGNIASE